MIQQVVVRRPLPPPVHRDRGADRVPAGLSGGAAAAAAGDYLLLAFPAADRLFERAVRDRIADVRSGVRTARACRRLLRQSYPSADLHRQQRVLVGGRATEIWFAHRDGRATAAQPDQIWWRDEDVARVVVDSGGRLSGANAACRALLGLPPRDRPVRRLSEFVSPEAYAALMRHGEDRVASDDPEVTSIASVRLAWGRRVTVEFHAVWEAVGPGRHVLALRTFADRDAAEVDSAVGASSLRLISREAQERILRGATRRDLAAMERLPASVVGDPWAVIVVAGIVRLYLGTEGLEPTLLYGDHGSLLGTHWAPQTDVVALGLQAVTPSVLLQLHEPAVQELVKSDPAFARAVIADGRELLGQVVAGFAARTGASLPQRLAREIMVLADLQPQSPLLAVTEQQLADGVGSIRESIGRTIAEFRRRGWLATTRHGVIVLDGNALRQAARLAPA